MNDGSASVERDFGAYCRHDHAARRGSPCGTLAGESFAAKCLFSVAGVRSCFGNPVWLASHPPASSTASVVSRLLSAGAMLRGFTLTDELALSLTGENAHYGTPENPAAPGRVPGGSSSGSAVAVACGSVTFALGTDTGGSVRVPASHTGLYGFRPTHGAIPLDGVLPLAPRFDTVGWLARTPHVLERVGDVVLPRGAGASGPRALQVIAGLEQFTERQAWGAYLQAAERLARALGVPLRLGHPDLDAPPALAWLGIYLTLQNLDAAGQHRAFLLRETPAFGSLIARRFRSLLETDPGERDAAEAGRAELERALLEQLARGSWLVTPSAPGAPPRLGLPDDDIEAYTARALTLNAPASLAGLPSLALPLVSLEGGPLGVSLIGAPGADRSLLRAAATTQSVLILEPRA